MGAGHFGLCATALVAAAVSGCGPSPKSVSASSSVEPPAKVAAAIPNACDVFDAATAKKYLGPDAELKRKYQANPQMTQCQYGSGKGIITVMVGPWTMIHTGNPQDKATPGLGDEAYISPGGLDVRKGDLGLNVGVMVMSGEFWGKAADDMQAKTAAAEMKVAPGLVARL